MAQAQNNLPAEITESINNIIAELNAFSENVTNDYTLAGSVAVYLFVYSLYVNEQNADKKKIIKRELYKLPKPNDIDIIIYTQGHLSKEKLSAYKKKNPKNGNNNTIPALNSVDGLPIIRRVTPIFKIDLIIINLQDPTKKLGDSIPLTFTHNGIEKLFNIVHPQNLIRLYAPDENRDEIQQKHNSIKCSVLEKLKEQGLLPEKPKPVSRYVRASMRGLSFGNGNAPGSERKSSTRRMSFGNGNSPSSATKRKRSNSGNLAKHPFSTSPPKTKKPSVARRFNFGDNSS